jgi:hypothetical protein
MPGSTISETRHRKEAGMSETYKIIRKYKDDNHPDNDRVIKTDLTLKEARDHCNDPDSHEEGVWFDAFYEED